MQRSNIPVTWVQEEEEREDGAEARLGEMADWEFSRKDKIHQPVHTFLVWAVIFKWGQSPPRERSVVSGDTCGCLSGGRGCLGIWGEARDAAKRPAVCRTVPTARDYLARMSKVLRWRNPAWAFLHLLFPWPRTLFFQLSTAFLFHPSEIHSAPTSSGTPSLNTLSKADLRSPHLRILMNICVLRPSRNTVLFPVYIPSQQKSTWNITSSQFIFVKGMDELLKNKTKNDLEKQAIRHHNCWLINKVKPF